MSPDHDLRAALRRLEDREAIRDLHTHYCFVRIPDGRPAADGRARA